MRPVESVRDPTPVTPNRYQSPKRPVSPSGETGQVSCFDKPSWHILSGPAAVGLLLSCGEG